MELARVRCSTVGCNPTSLAAGGGHSGPTNEMPFVELNNVLYIYQLGIVYAIIW